MHDEDFTDKEYFSIYNERYYSSNLDGGLFGWPDLSMAGTNDAELYVIEVKYCMSI